MQELSQNRGPTAQFMGQMQQLVSEIAIQQKKQATENRERDRYRIVR